MTSLEGSAEESGRPLAGKRIVVIDGGPACAWLARTLIDLGAEVAGEAPPADAAQSSFWSLCDRGVRRTTPEEALTALESADVVLTESVDAPTDRWRTEWPELVAVVFTPAGRVGPDSNVAASDLTNIASSGYLRMTGSPGRSPIKSTIAYLSHRHAANHALVALMLALRRHRLTGSGSTVDVAIRESHLWMLTNVYQYQAMKGVELVRRDHHYLLGDEHRQMPSLFEVADGYIVWMPYAGRSMESLLALTAWMAEEQAAPAWLRTLVATDFELVNQGQVDDFVAPFAAFFRTHTRAELESEAMIRGVMIAAVNTIPDLLDDPHLEARGAWQDAMVDGSVVRLPARPVHISGVDWRPESRRPKGSEPGTG